MSDPLRQMIPDIEEGVAKRYAGTDYMDSYIAFLDILGMKERLKRPYGDLRAVFNVAESGMELYGRIRAAGGKQFISQNHLKMMIMSDALVLSIDSSIDQSFSKLIGFSSYLINSLLMVLDPPVFLRGGITRGPIFQDGNTVFGPGLVDAYRQENGVAKSMRCIVSPTLDGDAAVREYLAAPGCALVVDPEDGLRFINFLRPQVQDKLKCIAAKVIGSDVKDDLKEKYRWLSRYLEEWGGV